MPAIDCDPQALIEASKCYNCIPEGMQDAVIIYQLCQLIQSGGGGGTGNACLIAGSGAPVAPCQFPFGLAYDNDSSSPTAGSFWFWDSTNSQWIPFSV